MNYKNTIILKNILMNKSSLTQRNLSKLTGFSLGYVNEALKELKNKHIINDQYELEERGKNLFNLNKPKNAIILAAGMGLRMLPLEEKVSKGLLKVHEEILIERLIRQLKEVGIKDITIVTGFDKERYEYLKDKFKVNLVFNDEYKITNNAYSLSLVKEKIDNTYIIPCDIYIKQNCFSKHEISSWYGMLDERNDNSYFSINKKTHNIEISNKNNMEMTGIAFINKDDSKILRNSLEVLSKGAGDDIFWEEFLSGIIEKNKLGAKDFRKLGFEQINSYEDLRKLGAENQNLSSRVIEVLEEVFDDKISTIKNISIVKSGMTNRSLKFSYKDKYYIMRIPGFGTQHLINRKEEAVVYKLVSKEGISDKLVYINGNTGIKITEFVENSRVCDASLDDDLKCAMEKLKELHDLDLKVDHYFDIYQMIEYYESLWEGKKSDYVDYEEIKAKIKKLKPIIDKIDKELKLCHIDINVDNVLLTSNKTILIDWEYSAMQDPHVDIAVFGIYSMMNKERIDRLIEIYFNGMPDSETLGKIYAYVAIFGLLWSNWCEYKKIIGDDFGDYSLAQYHYAKDYYYYAMEILNK